MLEKSFNIGCTKARRDTMIRLIHVQDSNKGASYRIYRNDLTSTCQQHRSSSSRTIYKCSRPSAQPHRQPQWPPRREEQPSPPSPTRASLHLPSSATNTSSISAARGRGRTGRYATEFLRRKERKKKKDTLRVPQLRTSQPPPTLLPRVIGGAVFCRFQSLMSYRRPRERGGGGDWRTEGWLRPGWEAGGGKIVGARIARGLG